MLVFKDGAVVFIQVRHQIVVLVLNSKEHVHQVDLQFECGDRLVLFGGSRRMAYRRGVGRGRKLGPSVTAGEGKKNEKGGDPANGHATHLDGINITSGSTTGQCGTKERESQGTDLMATYYAAWSSWPSLRPWRVPSPSGIGSEHSR